jgi:hypothetical protein
VWLGLAVQGPATTEVVVPCTDACFMLVNSACTEAYELDVGAFDVQCQDRPSVGIKTPWTRGIAGCNAPAFYLKSNAGCSGPFRWSVRPPGF